MDRYLDVPGTLAPPQQDFRHPDIIDAENMMNGLLEEQALYENSLDFIGGPLLKRGAGMMSGSRQVVRPQGLNLERGYLADQKFKNLFTGSSANLLENPSITGNPTRYKRNLNRVDNIPPGDNPMFPIRPSAFDTQANNLGGMVDDVVDQKTRFDTLMAKKPLLDDDGFPIEFSHGSTNVFKEFGTSKISKNDLVNPQNDWGDWSWHTPSSNYARPYSRNELGKEVVNSNMQKNYLFPEKVFDPQNAEQYKELSKWMHNKQGADNLDDAMIEDMIVNIGDRKKGYATSEQPWIKNFLEESGYDAQYIYHAGVKNLMMKNPNRIKNINNRGTFDLSVKDTMLGIGGIGLYGSQGGEDDVW